MIEYALSGRDKETKTKIFKFSWEVVCLRPYTVLGYSVINYIKLTDMTGGD